MPEPKLTGSPLHLQQKVGVSDATASIADPAVKDALRRETDAAIGLGVFGVPTLAVGNELFWGVDATDMAFAYMNAHARYDDPEYARVASLPDAAQRRALRSTVRS